jgi:hypothetical protein
MRVEFPIFRFADRGPGWTRSPGAVLHSAPERLPRGCAADTHADHY